MKGVWAVPIILGILILGTALTQEAEAETITISDQASCLDIPGATFTVAGPSICILNNDFAVNAGDNLIIENVILAIGNSVFTNSGTVVVVGGTTSVNQGVLFVGGADGQIINECDGVIIAFGGSGALNGAIGVDAGASLTNKGLIVLVGGFGEQSGSLTILDGTANNHGQINEGPGDDAQSGIINIIGSGIFNDNLNDLCISDQDDDDEDDDDDDDDE